MGSKHSTLSFAERLELHTERIPEAGCWLWTGATSRGYGVLGGSGRTTVKAHRAMYERYVGPIPAGMFLCHRCDVRECVNPHHMFIGTAADNNRDMREKGRNKQVRGDVVKNAILTADIVRAIRKLHAETRSKHGVAKAFGLNVGTVSSVIYRINWKHID